MTHFTIACLIQANNGYCTGDGWSKDVRIACLYTEPQAQAKRSELAAKHPNAEIRYVVQNKAFNYHDGEEFAPDLFWARLYRFEEAETLIRDLSFQSSSG